MSEGAAECPTCYQVISLPEPIPVYVVYLPSWVDEAGLVHFRPDHYGRERVLARYFPSGF